jgi:thioredoxin 1
MSSFSELISSRNNVLVDFSADWCGPCKMLAPILKEVKQNLGDNIKIVKIDVDRNPALAQQYRVQGVPTMILFNQGQQVWRQSGVIPAHELTSLLQSKMAK